MLNTLNLNHLSLGSGSLLNRNKEEGNTWNLVINSEKS